MHVLTDRLVRPEPDREGELRGLEASTIENCAIIAIETASVARRAVGQGPSSVRCAVFAFRASAVTVYTKTLTIGAASLATACGHHGLALIVGHTARIAITRALTCFALTGEAAFRSRAEYAFALPSDNHCHVAAHRHVDLHLPVDHYRSIAQERDPRSSGPLTTRGNSATRSPVR